MIAQRLAPRSAPEVGDALRQCAQSGEAVRVEGGDTLRAMGYEPDRATIPLSMTKVHGIVAHEYHDLTCAVRAGTRLAAFDAELAERGQFVPLDAPLRAKATVGGTLAAGWLSPRRHLYGRARDAVIGTQTVLADGTLVHAGGMVVKNVTGYDMSKLYVGSFGTLGVLVQANFKTLPLPAVRRVLLAPLPEGTRDRAAAQLWALPVAPAAAICVEGFRKAIDGSDGIDGRAFVLLEGSQSLVDRATREIRSALGRAGVPETAIVDTGAGASFERVLDACIEGLGERSLSFRVLGDPATVVSRAVSARDAAHRCELFTDLLFDVMNGDVFLRVSDRDARTFDAKAEAFDDALTALEPRRAIVGGNARIRTALDPWGDPPQAIERMRALKAGFDPLRVLNPGRFVGRI
ncbi:MAG TPA: FAD-binding oxidoreductase [Candidatus Baltobacteraceae bacterium]|nr:FAD-binding oxidoreductase [Candidatus Baltobacteraceae bacterium]